MKSSFLAVPALIAATISLTGCASIVDGTHQQIQVQTPPAQAAHCVLSNDKGQWEVYNTPNVVKVHKSIGVLYVTCDKHGYYNKTRVVESTTKVMLAGNIVFGSFLGAGIDTVDGAAFEYPHTIIVPLTKKHHHHVTVKTTKMTVKKIK